MAARTWASFGRVHRRTGMSSFQSRLSRLHPALPIGLGLLTNWEIPPAATGDHDYPFGTAGDIPVPGDYDGDGVTDLAVFRPSTGVWHVSKSSSKFTANLTAQWGTSTDIPVSGDFDGDAKTDFAIFRPGDGTWWITFSSGKDMCGNNATTATHYWGVSGDIPIPRAY